MVDIGYIIGLLKGMTIGAGEPVVIDGLSISEDEEGFLLIEEAENGE